MNPRFSRVAFAAILAPAALICRSAWADSASLAGIHWWGYYDYGVVDAAPATLLDSTQAGAWDTEIVNTHGPSWQNAGFFQPLFADLYANKNVSIVTRVEYQYGITVPSPTTIDTATWGQNVRGVVDTLKSGSHLWQLGNEPNLTGEGNGWTNNQITAAGYAEIYRQTRAAIQSAGVGAPGAHKLIVAPVSPGDVAGERWQRGVGWLDDTLAALTASNTPVDGIAIHAYGGSVAEFRRSIAEQVAKIDDRGYTNVPIYVTEWNRYADPNAVDANAQEAAAADFVRGAFAAVDAWNRTPGNHNIKALNYFVYDSGDRNNTAAAPWAGYSLKYWKEHGNAVGTSGDLYTAFADAVDQRYASGLDGRRAMPAGVTVIEDFERSAWNNDTDSAATNGRFSGGITTSPQSQGLKTSGAGTNSFVVANIDDSMSHSASQKLGLFDTTGNSAGWVFRHAANGGTPAADAKFTVSSAADDGKIGYFLKVLTSSGDASTLFASILVDSNAGGGNDTDAGVARTVIADGQWHYYEWSIDNATDWTIWRDRSGARIAGDGALVADGTISVDSIWLGGGEGANVEYFFDTVAHVRSGSLAALAPRAIPEPAAMLLLAPMLLARRR